MSFLDILKRNSPQLQAEAEPAPEPKPSPRKPTPQPFLKELPFVRGGKQPVYQMWRYIYVKPIPAAYMDSKAIVGISPKLYNFTMVLLRDGISAFHAVPAVRKYFGDRFIKGITFYYDRPEEYLVFKDLEDDENSIRFTKELAMFVTHMIGEWMIRHKIMLNWRIDGFQFMTEEKAKSTDLWLVDWDLRIVWVPD